MELFVLDQSFEAVAVVDAFESLLWVDRYNTYGDVELYVPATLAAVQTFQSDYYLWTRDSEHMMIIEDQEISSDLEEGNKLIITGRSLESIIERRIVWQQTDYSGKIQDVIKQLITESIINPTDQLRQIPNFIFEDNDDPNIDAITVEFQATGDNIYNIITQLLQTHQLGYKITLNSQNQFVFKLYFGEDRSYDQDVNPYVIFSPKFENIINSNYLESRKDYKNVALVAGSGTGSSRRTVVVPSENTPSGLLRREVYVEARDVQNGTDAQLKTRGETALAENDVAKVFEGETETTQMFVYNEDFFLGDIVQLENEYGMQSRTRVTEMVMSQDDTGFSAYPTFSVID